MNAATRAILREMLRSNSAVPDLLLAIQAADVVIADNGVKICRVKFVVHMMTLTGGRKMGATDVTAKAPPFHRAPPCITVPDLVLVKR